MHLHVLSNINMAPFEACFSKTDIDKVTFCDYNNYLIDLINQESSLYENKARIVFFHLDGEELLKEGSLSFLYNQEELTSEVNDILSAIKHFVEINKNTVFILSTIVFSPFNLEGYLKIKEGFSYEDLEYGINSKLISLSRLFSNVLILDFRRIVSLYGYENIFDDKYWYLGRIKYANIGFQMLAEEMQYILSGFNGKTKKVLVVDLDNTLWGGVIGEEGLDKIGLSEDGPGKIYRDFQKGIKALKQQGVILAINSKNNESEVKEVFENCPMMILKYEDFIVRRVNWNDKVSNMREIADELNLDLDSFVFIDDNKVEREIVKKYLNAVSVPEFPEDISQLKRWFVSEVIYKYFPKINLTDEDIQKTAQYHRNIKRSKLQKNLNIDDFIASLNINLKVIKNSRKAKVRIAQLIQKTNQFNLTTKRYQENQIEAFIAEGKIDIYTLDYEDKYGYEGIVGVAIVKINHDVLVLDSFILSCRVIGRNIEYAFLGAILNNYIQKIKVIKGEYVPTQKNAIAKLFYPNCGFKEKEPNIYEAAIKDVINIIEKKSFARIICNE